MKGLTIFTCLVFIICVLCSFLPLSDEAEIYDNTVRLHVIANSDSEYDQNVKLRVRDGVLSLIEELVKDAENIEEAENIIRENISAIRDNSRETLNLLGEDKSIAVTLSKEYYPTREYEDFSLPAGEYMSLRIMIGEAKGKNWWCVLYPELCTGGAKTEI